MIIRTAPTERANFLVAMRQLNQEPRFQFADSFEQKVIYANGRGRFQQAVSLKMDLAQRKIVPEDHCWAFSVTGLPLQAKRHFGVLIGWLNSVPVFGVWGPDSIDYVRFLTQVCVTGTTPISGTDVLTDIRAEYVNATLENASFDDRICEDVDPLCFCLDGPCDPTIPNDCDLHDVIGQCGPCASNPYAWHFNASLTVENGLCDILLGLWSLSWQSTGSCCTWTAHRSQFTPGNDLEWGWVLNVCDDFSGGIVMTGTVTLNSILLETLTYHTPFSSWNCLDANVLTLVSAPAGCPTTPTTITIVPGGIP